MHYLLPFFFGGFFLIAMSVLQYSQPWQILLTALAFMVAFAFQSWLWIGIVLAASAVYAAWTNDPNWFEISVMNACGWGLFSVLLAARCPRCEYNIAPSRNPFQQTPPNEWCPMCGRSRKGVWPLQYMLKPESWDGEYHDEGGGAASDSSNVDWWRNILFKRKQKQSKRLK